MLVGGWFENTCRFQKIGVKMIDNSCQKNYNSSHGNYITERRYFGTYYCRFSESIKSD